MQRYKWISFFIFFGAVFSNSVFAQTVGNLFTEPTATKGFTLFSPTTFNKTYLVDNCGYIYNVWEHEFTPGLKSFLDDKGSLYIAQEDEDPKFNIAGGSGGVIEKFDWNGNKEWRMVLSNDTIIQHHDFIQIPNGNFLFLLSHRVTKDQAISLGRDTTHLNENGLLSEIIVELEINESGDFEVVWQWKAIDHLIQNYDPSLENFGEPSDFPGRININIGEIARNTVDWLHFNSIDYSEEYDQILISSRSINEIFIIDKSTSIAQAASHSGGNAGKGGDLIFRWGNPVNYTLDSLDTQNLYGQHDAKFIDEGAAILVYNNGTARGDTISYSSTDEIALTRDGFNFDYLGNEANQKQDIVWTYYNQDDPGSFYSKIMSGVIRLANGNNLVTEATKGKIFEVDQEGEILRTYVVPVNFAGPMTQFEIPQANTIFKARFYEEDFFNQDEIDLVNSNIKIEFNPIDNCELVSVVENDFPSSMVTLSDQGFLVQLENKALSQVSLFDLNGRLLFSENFEQELIIPTHGLPLGIYFISVSNQKMGMVSHKVFKF